MSNVDAGTGARLLRQNDVPNIINDAILAIDDVADIISLVLRTIDELPDIINDVILAIDDVAEIISPGLRTINDLPEIINDLPRSLMRAGVRARLAQVAFD
jgi:hypothetical protein